MTTRMTTTRQILVFRVGSPGYWSTSFPCFSSSSTNMPSITCSWWAVVSNILILRILVFDQDVSNCKKDIASVMRWNYTENYFWIWLIISYDKLKFVYLLGFSVIVSIVVVGSALVVVVVVSSPIEKKKINFMGIYIYQHCLKFTLAPKLPWIYIITYLSCLCKLDLHLY